MKTTVTFRPNVARIALLTALVLWLLACAAWPVAAAPVAWLFAGASTALAQIPGPVVLVAVLALAWRWHRANPPAPVRTA